MASCPPLSWGLECVPEARLQSWSLKSCKCTIWYDIPAQTDNLVCSLVGWLPACCCVPIADGWPNSLVIFLIVHKRDLKTSKTVVHCAQKRPKEHSVKVNAIYSDFYRKCNCSVMYKAVLLPRDRTSVLRGKNVDQSADIGLPINYLEPSVNFVLLNIFVSVKTSVPLWRCLTPNFISNGHIKWHW
jgi:hypothetical protein